MQQQISIDVLQDKYLKGKERTRDDVFHRVAHGLAAVEKDTDGQAAYFLSAMEQGFIPAGRVLSACGTDLKATLINCFVQPVGDAMVGEADGKPGIMNALAQAAETMRRGGGDGYNFNHIRPAGSQVKGTDSQASGPLSYMRTFDAMCQTVVSAGSRRGAQMGVLRCDHPDIEAFIEAKARPYAEKELKQFNLSVGITDLFMEAVIMDSGWPLVHKAEPSEQQKVNGAYQREDGLWVYKEVQASVLFESIMRSTYDFADPGVLFLDRMNAENNLAYCEVIEATNPCAEQMLPDYGCCCLGSINLIGLVEKPFTSEAHFDVERLEAIARVAVRMLDNVLDVTVWPLEEQRAEAMAKRRIGLGFTGLGNVLTMMGLRYDSEEARVLAADIARRIRDAAYLASVELAHEKGAFPMLDVDKYLASGFTKNLPVDIRDAIKRHGIRNSHLLSIAPTGTISIAFGDNCSSGVEPVFSHRYTRKVRQADESLREYIVYDFGVLKYREVMGLDHLNDDELIAQLPEVFMTAEEIDAVDHIRMVEAIMPYVDTSVSKTINVAEDYPYEQFKQLYLQAWEAGLKGITTYRPNDKIQGVLSTNTEQVQPESGDDPDRCIRLQSVPEPVLRSLRWSKRPRPVGGNPSWTWLVEPPGGEAFAVFVGHIDNGHSEPFEVWINGAEQPRGLGALAKSLSMDMRSNDREWLKTKLMTLMKTGGRPDASSIRLELGGEQTMVAPSPVSAVAHLVYARCQKLGVFNNTKGSPMLDALFTRKEPKSGPDGTISRTFDVLNPATGDDFVLGIKELDLPNGQRRPYSIWLSGEYPRALDGLCKSLSLDMRVLDPAWLGSKLRQLLDYAEPQGDFHARVPNEKRQSVYPSTVAYLARLIIHRYAMLGLLDEEGFPYGDAGLVHYEDDPKVVPIRTVGAMEVKPGALCPECGNYARIRRDGCDFCTACGATGACG